MRRPTPEKREAVLKAEIEMKKIVLIVAVMCSFGCGDRKVDHRNLTYEGALNYYGRETTPFTGISYNCNGKWRMYEEGRKIKSQSIVTMPAYPYIGGKEEPTNMCHNGKKQAGWVTCVEAGEKELDKKEWDSLPHCQ